MLVYIVLGWILTQMSVPVWVWLVFWIAVVLKLVG